MKKLAGVIGIGTAVVLSSAAAFAEPDSAKGTMVQALESVEKNIAKNPGNRGLTNAATHLRNNARRHDEHQTALSEERMQLEHVGGLDRPDHPGRPDTVGRPDRLGLPGRPDNPGRPNR